VRLSLKSIISRGKPLNIIIEDPELRISKRDTEQPSLGKKGGDFTIPVFIESLFLRNGKFSYETSGLRLHSEGINAVFSQNKNNFTLYSKIKKNDLLIKEFERKIQGNLYLALTGRGKKLNLRRFYIKGPDGIIKAVGTIDDIFQPEMELRTSSFIDSSLVADLLKIPFNWRGNLKERGVLLRRNQEVLYRSELSSSSVILNQVNLGEVNGKVRYSDRKGGEVALTIKDGTGRDGSIDIEFDQKSVRGRVREVTLQPIANEISVPWPIYSKAWGEFSLKNKTLVVNANFRDSTERMDSLHFPLNGSARVEWNGEEKVVFSSSDIKSSFGDLEVDAGLNIDRDLDITIKGEIRDFKQARELTGLILEKKFEFPEIRGHGEAEIRIFGDYDRPQVNSDFSISEAGFDEFDANFVKGSFELIQQDFFGRFNVEDPSFRGIVGLFANPSETRVEVRCYRGETGMILKGLNVSLPIQGEGSGSFEYRKKDDKSEFSGVFSGEKISFAGQPLINVSGRIKGDDDSVELSELNFKLFKGDIKGSLKTNTSMESFDVNLKGERIDLSSVNENLKGLFSVDLKGRVELGKELVLGTYSVQNLQFSSIKETGTQGEIKIDYDENYIHMQIDGNFTPGENKFLWEMDVPLKEEAVSGKIEGTFNNLDLLLPWKGAKAKINYLLNLRIPSGKTEVKGAVDFQGSQLPFPRFAHALEDFSGLVFVENSHLSIRSIQGKIGGGPVEASGDIRLGKSGIEYIDITAKGNEMMLSVLERTQALSHGEMSLVKDEAGFVFHGDFFIEKLLWRRELNEEISFSAAPYPSYSQKPRLFDDLNLDIRLRAEKDAWIENSLGRIQTGFDLNIKGNVFSPVLQGEIEALGGTVYFQDREFSVLQGRVSFFNPASIDPYINFKGETYVKNYHVTFSLDGPLSNLRPEFSSSPPLPPEDVLALLALGQAFRRTYHYDRSIGQSMASLLSFQLSEEAKKRAEELFSIDRFRIDPFIMGSSAEMTARLTLGKKLSRSFFILYSTNLAAQREDITRIEWELSNDFSIVGTRDEMGRVSFDVKIYRRF
ncbi:MAG: translocation/assembly module TamB domain-containing protein, partial [Acidobacteriota bacterium]